MDDIFTPVDDNSAEVDLAETAKRFGLELSPENEGLVKAKAESDRFIKRLEDELRETREAFKKSTTLEEVRTTILEGLKNGNTPPNSQPPVTPPADKDDSPDIEALVSSLLEKKEVESRSKTNKEKVTNTLREKFGADAQLHLNNKAKELGVSVDYLAKIANDSPNAFFRLLGVDVAHTVSPPVTAPRSTQSAPLPSGTRNKAYYDKLKQTSPSEYFGSQEIRMQQYKDMMKLGDAYFN